METLSDIISIISAEEGSLTLPDAPSRDCDNLPAVDILIPETVAPADISEISRRQKWAFLRAWDPESVMIQAAALPFREWMDYFVKLSPKELQVKGSFEMKSLVAQLGPIQRVE